MGRVRLTEDQRRERWIAGANLRKTTAWVYLGCAVLNLAAVFFFDNIWSQLIMVVIAIMFAVGVIPLLRYEGFRRKSQS